MPKIYKTCAKVFLCHDINVEIYLCGFFWLSRNVLRADLHIVIISKNITRQLDRRTLLDNASRSELI